MSSSISTASNKNSKELTSLDPPSNMAGAALDSDEPCRRNLSQTMAMFRESHHHSHKETRLVGVEEEGAPSNGKPRGIFLELRSHLNGLEVPSQDVSGSQSQALVISDKQLIKIISSANDSRQQLTPSDILNAPNRVSNDRSYVPSNVLGQPLDATIGAIATVEATPSAMNRSFLQNKENNSELANATIVRPLTNGCVDTHALTLDGLGILLDGYYNPNKHANINHSNSSYPETRIKVTTETHSLSHGSTATTDAISNATWTPSTDSWSLFGESRQYEASPFRSLRPLSAVNELHEGNSGQTQSGTPARKYNEGFSGPSTYGIPYYGRSKMAQPATVPYTSIRIPSALASSALLNPPAHKRARSEQWSNAAPVEASGFVPVSDRSSVPTSKDTQLPGFPVPSIYSNVEITQANAHNASARVGRKRKREISPSDPFCAQKPEVAQPVANPVKEVGPANLETPSATGNDNDTNSKGKGRCQYSRTDSRMHETNYSNPLPDEVPSTQVNGARLRLISMQEDVRRSLGLTYGGGDKISCLFCKQVFNRGDIRKHYHQTHCSKNSAQPFKCPLEDHRVKKDHIFKSATDFVRHLIDHQTMVLCAACDNGKGPSRNTWDQIRRHLKTDRDRNGVPSIRHKLIRDQLNARWNCDVTEASAADAVRQMLLPEEHEHDQGV